MSARHFFVPILIRRDSSSLSQNDDDDDHYFLMGATCYFLNKIFEFLIKLLIIGDNYTNAGKRSMTQFPVQPSYSQSKTQLRPPQSLALKLIMTIKTAIYAIIILRNKNIMWEVASIHQLTSHLRVKISNQSKNVLFDLSVLMAR